MVSRALCCLAMGVWLCAPSAVAQAIPARLHLKRGDPQLSRSMADLASRALQTPAGQAPDDRFRLQLAAGQYVEAAATLAGIRGRRPLSDPALLLNLRWEIYARAKAGAARGQGFSQAFQEAAAGALRALDDLTAYKLLYSLGTPLPILDQG